MLHLESDQCLHQQPVLYGADDRYPIAVQPGEKLIAVILSKVPKDLYNEVINNLTERRHKKKVNSK